MTLGSLFFAAGIAGCAHETNDDLGVLEQHGTASQDVDVALLRRKFHDARDCFGEDDGLCHGFAPAARYETQGLFGKGKRQPSKTARAWSCKERDAKKDSPQKAKPVTYELVVDPEGVKLMNTGSGFGKVFVTWEDHLVGYPTANIPGALVTHDVLRHEGDALYEENGGVKPTLVFERVLRPATANLSAADRKTFEDLGEQYAPAVSIAGGLAVAYVECTSWVDR